MRFLVIDIRYPRKFRDFLKKGMEGGSATNLGCKWYEGKGATNWHVKDFVFCGWPHRDHISIPNACLSINNASTKLGHTRYIQAMHLPTLRNAGARSSSSSSSVDFI